MPFPAMYNIVPLDVTLLCLKAASSKEHGVPEQSHRVQQLCAMGSGCRDVGTHTVVPGSARSLLVSLALFAADLGTSLPFQTRLVTAE